MDDLNPSLIKAEGFRVLDRIVDVCAAQGIYTIIDLHTTPGGQNQGWHCDSGIHKALFWDFMNFQDRVVNLWVEIAKHYKDNTWVTGYNPLNEPADPKHIGLQAFYSWVEKVIREVDSDHILFLDGNTFSMDFTAFKEVLPNCVYAMHDYATMGFPAGDPYQGSSEQNEFLQKQYERKVEFMKAHGVPIWNGEFGPVYASEDQDGHEQTNQQRYNLLGQQLSIYKKENVGWSIWLYKDIGLQAYIRLLKPFLDKKKRLGVDMWGRDDTHIGHVFDPVLQHLKKEIPEQFQNKRYPTHWRLEGHFNCVLREMLVSELLTWEYASYFADKSFDELDELAASFKLENCNVGTVSTKF